MDLKNVGSSHRIFCKPCLDWTERRHHLGGVLGAALCDHCLAHGWLQRMRDSRAPTITPEGRAAFADVVGIDSAALDGSTDCVAA